jgi:tripartite-type tricarboxylate transporter receptor subunit TctC
MSALLVGIAVPGTASAQAAAYPARPIRLVIPFPAGGASDIICRLLADKMSGELHQQVIVENRPGGGTVIGVQAVSNSPADGYTILLGSTASMVTNVFLFRKLPYDPAAFEPVSFISVQPLVLVANPTVKANNITELMKYAKQNDNKLSYASFGTGTQSHLALELLNLRAGTTMAHVPYKGASEALPALIGDSVQLYADAVSTSLPYLKNGAVKALGVASPQRSAALPNVPTIAEQGFAGFDMTPWIGLFVLKGTPSDVLDKLRRTTEAIVKSPYFVEKLATFGQELPPEGPGAAALTAQIQRDLPKIQKLVKEARIEPQ